MPGRQAYSSNLHTRNLRRETRQAEVVVFDVDIPGVVVFDVDIPVVALVNVDTPRVLRADVDTPDAAEGGV